MPQIPGQHLTTATFFSPRRWSLFGTFWRTAWRTGRLAPARFLSARAPVTCPATTLNFCKFRRLVLAFLRIHTDGSITLDPLEPGVLTSDTAQLPEGKIPVHSWALESSSMIPTSALPGASGFVLTPLVSAEFADGEWDEM